MFHPNGNQLWCPGQSLWSLITENASKSELLNIRTALGHSLVDMYTEVHAEAEMWHKIWQKSQRGGNQGSREETALTCRQGSLLAEPPAVKELVRAEVKMLLQDLRQRVCKEGSDGEEVLSRYKPDVVNYALSHQDICYTRLTTLPPEDTENRCRPSSQCSVQSGAEDEIDAVRDKLNVTEIHEVVDRLRSLILENCKVLTTMLNHFKGNLKKISQSHCESEKSEPSLTELKELRGAIQTDLELYPCSLAAPSPLPVKGLKNSLRLPEGQSTATLPASASVLRPNPAPPLCHPVPSPPSGQPLSNTSPSRTLSLQRLTSVSNTLGKHQTYNGKDTSGLTSSPLSAKQKIVKNKHLLAFSPEKDDASFNCSASLSFHINPEKKLPSIETPLSSYSSFQRSDCDLFPRREGKISTHWNSRNINITPSPAPALSQLYDAGNQSRNDALHCVFTEGKLRAQNRLQNCSSEGSLELTAVHTDNRRMMIIIGSSVLSESLAQDGRKICNSGENRNRNSIRNGTKAISHNMREKMNGNILPAESHGGSTGQPRNVQEIQTQPTLLNKFYQPLPPAGVPHSPLTPKMNS